MRLEIILSPKGLKFSIPVNYNYLIYTSLNSIFNNGNGNFDSWMLNDICRYKIAESSKMFTFSKLLNTKVRVVDHTMSGYGDCKLLFSAPIEEDLAPLFIDSLWKSKGVDIPNESEPVKFAFKSIKQLPEPDFENAERFVMLSPTTISKQNIKTDDHFIHFHRINEDDTEGAIAYNLRKKYEAVHETQYRGELDVSFDNDYINYKGGAESVSKLITIRQGKPNEFKIKGFVAPLVIKGSPEILKIAYQCGIGERNTLGFGMLETTSFRQ